MKVCGIVAEYNPFHNGHRYLIEQARQAGATHIVAAMSGAMVQRGGLAMFSKATRVRCALLSGVDLVVELPAPFSCSAAETFARSAVHLLTCAGIDMLCFGSESGDVDRLRRIAGLIGSEAYDARVRQLMATGVSYPTAAAQAAAALLDEPPLKEPNDALGVSYIRALCSQRAEVELLCVKRQGAGHDARTPQGTFASASHIRALMAADDPRAARPFLPPAVLELLARDAASGACVVSDRDYDLLALYRLRQMDEAAFSSLPDVSEGLGFRLMAAARGAAGLPEFYRMVKTKRYTLARIRRIVGYALLGVTKADVAARPAYLRLLGFSPQGRALLAAIKARAHLPLLSSVAKIEQLSPLCRRQTGIERQACDLWGMCQKSKAAPGQDYRNLVIIT